MNTPTLLKISGLLFASIVVWYSLFIISPPAPKPASAPQNEFSAHRAFTHVKHLATTPRPLGSAANDSARTYLFRQLNELGLQPFIQEGVGVNSRRGVAGYTRNILAELPGSNPDKTIMLMAHYDSVPEGPGAGDDASGVAAILEVLRTLTSGDPLRHNVLALFTDGEERGLLGAELFINQYADWEQIDLVINVEARGTGGPSIMFETSENNAELIPHFARATKHPVANSLTYTIYKILPNNTDLSIMKQAGLRGLNYAIIGDYLNYHTMQDSPENLSLASLQHHGENLLDNVRYFASNSSGLEGEADNIYFNNLTGGVAYYPANWSFPLAVALAFTFIIFAVFLARKEKINLPQYLLSTLSYLLLLFVGALTTYYLWKLIRWIHPEYRWLIQGETYNHSWYLAGFSALILALATAYTGWLSPKLKKNNLMAGVYTVWILLTLVVSWHLPPASYLFFWPALFGLLGWVTAGPQLETYRLKPSVFLWLSLLPALFILPPYIKLIQVTLTTELLAISMVLLLLLAGLCLPLFWQLTDPGAKYWAAALAAIFIFCTAGAAINSGFDANHKKQNNLIYFADYDTQQAYWLSRDHTPDDWTSQFIGDSSAGDTLLTIVNRPFRDSRLLKAPAPLLSLRQPVIRVTADSSTESLRYLSLEMHSQEPAIGMHVKLTDGQAFRSVSVFGRTLHEQQYSSTLSPSFTQFYYFGNLTETIELELVTPNNSPDTGLEISFIRNELPAGLMSNYKPREPYMMPTPFGVSDATVWKMTYRLSDL